MKKISLLIATTLLAFIAFLPVASATGYAGNNKLQMGVAEFTGQIQSFVYAGSNPGPGGLASTYTRATGLVGINMAIPRVDGTLSGSAGFDTEGFNEGFGPRESTSEGFGGIAGNLDWSSFVNKMKMPTRIPMRH